MHSTNPEIIYQSPETTPAGDPFITVKKARGYYYYSERGGINSVFFILYDKSTSKYCLINESKPPLDESRGGLTQLTTAFGGSLDDPSKSPDDIVVIETLEEAGYIVPAKSVHYVGKSMVSTQSSQVAYGYLVNVTGISKSHKSECDDSSNSNSLVWLTYSELLLNSDWKSIFIAAKFKEELWHQL